MAAKLRSACATLKRRKRKGDHRTAVSKLIDGCLPLDAQERFDHVCAVRVSREDQLAELTFER
jgi:hypothetical protein